MDGRGCGAGSPPVWAKPSARAQRARAPDGPCRPSARLSAAQHLELLTAPRQASAVGMAEGPPTQLGFRLPGAPSSALIHLPRSLSETQRVGPRVFWVWGVAVAGACAD